MSGLRRFDKLLWKLTPRRQKISAGMIGIFLHPRYMAGVCLTNSYLSIKKCVRDNPLGSHTCFIYNHSIANSIFISILYRVLMGHFEVQNKYYYPGWSRDAIYKLILFPFSYIIILNAIRITFHDWQWKGYEKSCQTLLFTLTLLITNEDLRSNWKDNEPRKLNFLLRGNDVVQQRILASYQKFVSAERPSNPSISREPQHLDFQSNEFWITIRPSYRFDGLENWYPIAVPLQNLSREEHYIFHKEFVHAILLSSSRS